VTVKFSLDLFQLRNQKHWTVQTSAEANLTSAAILRISMNECSQPVSVSPNSDESRKQSLYSDSDPDRHQNLTTCSMASYQPFLKISCKSVGKFLRKVANKQTNRQRQTNNDDHIKNFLAEVISCFRVINKAKFSHYCTSFKATDDRTRLIKFRC